MQRWRTLHDRREQTPRAFRFPAYTGARPSEAFGLKWTDVDFETGHVTIQRTLQWHRKKEGGGWFFEETKTKTSRHSVPLPASMVQHLREHRAAQAEALLKLGIRTDLVFATTEGTPILRRNLVRTHFKPAMLEAGRQDSVSLYALRHTPAPGRHPPKGCRRAARAQLNKTHP